jgi:hypothetical protein
VQTKPTSDYVHLPHPNLQRKYTEHTENNNDSGSEYSELYDFNLEYDSDSAESETETAFEKQTLHSAKEKEVRQPTEQPAAVADPGAFSVQPTSLSEDSTLNATDD